MVNTSKHEKIATGLVWLAYFVYGIASSLMNTTLTDLTEILHTDLQTVSYGLLLRAVFHCIGAPLFAWSFTVFNREIQYALSLALFGLGTCFTASSNSKLMFFIFNSLAGLSTSGIDITSYTWILEIYKENANPYLQAMGGFWAVGQTLAPLINRPFLSSNQTIIQENGSTITKHVKTSIQVPYNVIGGLIIAVGGLVMLFSCISDKQLSNKSTEKKSSFKNENLSTYKSTSDRQISDKSGRNGKVNGEDSSLLPKTLPKAYHVIIVILAALIMNFQVGLDLDFFSFLHTYAVEGPTKMNKSDASYLVSLTGLVQLASRFVSIFISIYIRPGSIISTSTLVTLAGIIILIISGSTLSGLWAGAIILSIGFAPVGSSIYTYLEERTTVTNAIVGVLTFSSTILSTSGPYVVGSSISTHPFIFILYILVCNVSIIVIFIFLLLSDLWRRRYLAKQKRSPSLTNFNNQSSYIYKP